MNDCLDAKILTSLLSYDEQTGVFVWRAKRKGIKIGDVAGSNANGRSLIKVFGKSYYSYRLAWLYMTGSWPEGDIDHIDGNPMNNRFSNLRDVSRRTNIQNQRAARKNNKCGHLGVTCGHNGKFLAKICNNGKNIHLGTFATAELAKNAYIEAKRRLHDGCVI